MNSAIFATTQKPESKPQSFKGKKLKVTGPDGRVYRFTWSHDRKPTQSDMDWAVGEAKRMSEEAPVNPFGGGLDAEPTGAPDYRPGQYSGGKAQAPQTVKQTAKRAAPVKGVYQDRPASKGPIPMAAPEPQKPATGAVAGSVAGGTNAKKRGRFDPWKDEPTTPANMLGPKRELSPREAKLAKAYQGGRMLDIMRAHVEDVGEQITENPVTNFLANVERLAHAPSKLAGKKGYTGHVAGLTGAALTQPLKSAADVVAIGDPKSTLQERLGGAGGLALDFLLPAVGAKVIGKVAKGLKEWDPVGNAFSTPHKAEFDLNPVSKFLGDVQAQAPTTGAQGAGGGKKGKVSVRPSTYRGQEGFTVSGTDGQGRRVKMFFDNEAEAIQHRTDINQGVDVVQRELDKQAPQPTGAQGANPIPDAGKMIDGQGAKGPWEMPKVASLAELADEDLLMLYRERIRRRNEGLAGTGFKDYRGDWRIDQIEAELNTRARAQSGDAVIANGADEAFAATVRKIFEPHMMKETGREGHVIEFGMSKDKLEQIAKNPLAAEKEIYRRGEGGYTWPEDVRKAVEDAVWQWEHDAASFTDYGNAFSTRDAYSDLAESLIKQGKPVHPDILADFPDLAAKYKTPTQSPTSPPDPPQTTVQGARTMYREASGAELLTNDFINPGSWWTDNPDLAIGQGSNKGVIYEFEFSKDAKLVKGGKALPDGAGAEYQVGPGNQQGSSSGRPAGVLKSVTVKPGAQLPQDVALNLQRFSDPNNPNSVWVREDLPDGSTRYTPKAKEQGARTGDTGGGVQEPQAAKNEATAQYRKDLGLDELPDADAQTFGGWLEDAQKNGTIARARVIAKAHAEDPKRILNAEETVGMAARMAGIKRRVKHLQGQSDPASAAELQDLLDEAGEISTALKTSGTEAARAMVARQAGVTPDYDVVTLRNRAKGLNNGEDLTAKQTAQADDFAGRIERLETDMANIREQVALQLRQEAKRPNPKGSVQSRRDSAINTLRKYGLPTADEGVQMGGMPRGKGKGRTGAVANPFAAWAANDVVRRSVRQLVRTYHETGASSLDDVLALLKKDIPGLDEDQYLALLSDRYKAVKLESDVAKLQAERFLKGVQKAADARTRPIATKVASEAWKAISSVQRAIQTSMDIGGTLIQGGKAIADNPLAVARAVKDQVSVIPTIKTRDQFDRLWAAIESDPMYARAKKAGVQFDTFDSPNEFFGEGIVTKIPGIFKSDAAFKAYKNRLRLELFKSWAKVAPDDAGHLLSAANMANVMTGTAVGKAGVTARGLGGVFYAPSYELSKWQFALGQPLIHAAKTNGMKSAAFRQAAGVYAKQALVFMGGVWALKEAGIDIDTDPRSSDFGKLTTPNGAQFDLFGKAYSPLRTVAQSFFEQITRKGDVRQPDDYGVSPIESYVGGKLAPMNKLMYDLLRKGERYNFDTGEAEPVSLAGTAKDMLPMGVKDVASSWDVAGPFALLALLGIGVGEAKRPTPGKQPQKPMTLPRGIEKRLGR